MSTKEKATECPDCGTKRGPHRFSWDTEKVPCADLRECIRNLKERLEQVERILENHNLG